MRPALDSLTISPPIGRSKRAKPNLRLVPAISRKLNRLRLIRLTAKTSMSDHLQQDHLPAVNASKRLDNLTGLRGVAAYAVLFAHSIEISYYYGGPPPYELFDPLAKHLAYFGMSLFFVLSGFVIHYNYARLFQIERFGRAVYTFFIARFARLYPLYALVILWQCHPEVRQSITGVFADRTDVTIAYVTLTQSWFNMQDRIFGPAWSVSTEVFFYTFFALGATQFGKLKNPAIGLIVFSLAVIVGFCGLIKLQAQILPLVDALLFQGPGISADSSTWFWYYSPLVRLPEFVVGMLASATYCKLRASNALLGLWLDALALVGVSWCVGIVLCGAFSHMPLGTLTMNFCWAPAIAAILVGTTGRRSRLSLILSSHTMVAAGTISYSVYIVQFPVFFTIGTGGGADATITPLIVSTLKFAIIVLLTTCFAYGTYNLFEIPMQRLVRRLMFARPVRAPVAVTTIAVGQGIVE
jgi:peptidoglycan/LPS O-acetylase OafA/YrhL